MPRVGYEPMTPVFEQAKTVHALDRGATVTVIYTRLDLRSLIFPSGFLTKIK
jgi:hypothetical protein